MDGTHHLCAVAGCAEPGKRQRCPYDGATHKHGRIHYNCGQPVHSLVFRTGGSFLICDEHYEIVRSERAEWERGQRLAAKPDSPSSQTSMPFGEDS